MLDVQVSEIERQYIQITAVDDHELAVIARQVVRAARHCDACRQKPHFQFTEIPLATAVGISNQRMHEYTAAHRAGQRLFNFAAVEAEDDNFNAFFGVIDGLHQGHHAIARLHSIVSLQALPRGHE